MKNAVINAVAQPCASPPCGVMQDTQATREMPNSEPMQRKSVLSQSQPRGLPGPVPQKKSVSLLVPPEHVRCRQDSSSKRRQAGPPDDRSPDLTEGDASRRCVPPVVPRIQGGAGGEGGRRMEKQDTQTGGGDADSTCSEHLKTTATNHIKMLKIKQQVMETVMRKLLQSLKELKTNEESNGRTCETERERRLKVTRMMQLLMLQRKNLQMQTDTLTASLSTLKKKHELLRKHSEGCIVENVELSQALGQLRCEMEKKDTHIKGLMQLSEKLQKQLEVQAGAEIALENTEFELKRLKIDNENLRQANQQLECIFAEKVKERETTSLMNAQLMQDLERSRAELANVRIRCEKVTAENQALRNQLAISEAGTKDLCLRKAEMEQLREQYESLQFSHQRLQALYISETETRRALHNQLQEVNGNIRVICRFRPSTDEEDSESLFEFCAMDKVFVAGRVHPSTKNYKRQLGLDQPSVYSARDEYFSFNRIFQQNATQMDIFQEIRPLIASCVDGYNVCILAYGPTGSGKTYSMQGTKTEPGISTRAVRELFDLVEPLQGVWNTDISVAMFEIHNEVIYDLLGQQIHPVRLSDNGLDVRLIDSQEKITSSEQETLYWIEKGYMRRKMTATKLNVESSRSHLIIRMQLGLTSTIDGQKRSSTLVFCDLAGSESAERIDASGSLHVETGYINKSLVTLARVLETLRKRTNLGTTAQFSNLAVPYRDSKLTHLLKPCLGGQAKCVLLVTASPETSHLDRTIKALEFAQRAMQVALGKPSKNLRILETRNSAKT
nr:unnamed protein product [Spirometra erinaceieuropaei]